MYKINRTYCISIDVAAKFADITNKRNLSRSPIIEDLIREWLDKVEAGSVEKIAGVGST